MSTVIMRDSKLTVIRYCGSQQKQNEEVSGSPMRFQVTGKNEFGETVKLDLSFESAGDLSNVLREWLVVPLTANQLIESTKDLSVATTTLTSIIQAIPK